MCGIVGVWHRDGRPVDTALLERQRDAMRHRGPDDEGTWIAPAGDVGLGHRRLAIVDLSAAGRQPMGNEDGSVLVTYNGEIYNHEALRAELDGAAIASARAATPRCWSTSRRSTGRTWSTASSACSRSRSATRPPTRVFVARDRLGIKPLYWLDDGRTFACASEIKALLPLLARREVDEVALRHYLTFVAVPPPRTLFAGVSKLAPASTLLIGRDGPQAPRRYWDPLAARADYDGTAIDWAAELRFRLERSIDRRMMSDVPVGVFLSGGVDSSTNVALMSRLVDHPIDTFSIGFDGADRYNEFAWARRVAEQFGTDHHEVSIGPDDLWGFLPDLVHHQDEPIADPVCVPLHFVARLAKQHGVTVVHVGEGADELLAGYPTYVQALAMEQGPWRRFRQLPGRCAAPRPPRAGRCSGAARATSCTGRRCAAARRTTAGSGGAVPSPSTSRASTA